MFRASSFYLPQDKSTPLIMIGPGTGIAPFRSFWQQAEYEHMQKLKDSEQPLRNLNLYFGCRNSELDDIYADETEILLKKKILGSVRTAYSREKTIPKVRYF